MRKLVVVLGQGEYKVKKARGHSDGQIWDYKEKDGKVDGVVVPNGYETLKLLGYEIAFKRVGNESAVKYSIGEPVDGDCGGELVRDILYSDLIHKGNKELKKPSQMKVIGVIIMVGVAVIGMFIVAKITGVI